MNRKNQKETKKEPREEIAAGTELNAEAEPETELLPNIDPNPYAEPEDGGESIEPVEGKKKGGKKKIVIPLIILLFVAALAALYFIFYTPSVQFALSAEKLITQDVDDYTVFDGLSSTYKIHSAAGRTGRTDSDIGFSVSSNGKLLDAIFASYINRWSFKGETVSDGEAMSGSLDMSFGRSGHEFISYYGSKEFNAVSMFGGDYALSAGNPAKLFDLDSREDKWVFLRLMHSVGRAGDGDMFSMSFIKHDTAFGDSKWCKKLSLDMDGADAQAVLTDICERIEGNEKLFSYFNEKTYKSEEKTREKLEELKSYFEDKQDYTIKASIYKRFGKVIAVELELSNGAKGKTFTFCQETRKNKDGGYDRHVVIGNEKKTYTVESSTSGDALKCSDSGTITVDKNDKSPMRYDYSVEHSAEKDEDGLLSSIDDEISIIATVDSPKQYTITAHNTSDEGLTKGRSEILYNSQSMTFGVMIDTVFTEDESVEPNRPEKLIQLTDESGLMPNPEIKERIDEVKESFWDSEIFKSLSEGTLIPQNVFENILFKLFGVNREQADKASGTGGSKASGSDKSGTGSDNAETETETETEFVYEPEVETKPPRDNRTWEEIQEDDKYTSSFWERFWGYYWSDDGYFSDQYDNIIDYFNDFVEKYF